MKKHMNLLVLLAVMVGSFAQAKVSIDGALTASSRDPNAVANGLKQMGYHICPLTGEYVKDLPNVNTATKTRGQQTGAGDVGGNG